MAPFTLARLVLLACVLAAAMAPCTAFAAPPDDDVVYSEDGCTVSFPCNFSPLDNDPGNPTEITAVSDPPHGTAVIRDDVDPTDSIDYSPDPNYCNDPPGGSPDTFTYNNGSATPTVSITVTCVDDPPTAKDDPSETPDPNDVEFYEVPEDSAAVLFPVLANDDDGGDGPFGAKLEIASPFLSDSAQRGTASVSQGDPNTPGDLDQISYQPHPNRCAGDNVGYRLVGAGPGVSGNGYLHLSITCTEDLPVANDDTRTLALGSGTVQIDVLSNDSDADNLNLLPEDFESIPIIGLTQPGNGTASIVQGSGDVAVDKIAYTPRAGTCGTDSFTYTVNNDSEPNANDTATVTITVSCAKPIVRFPPPLPTASAKTGKLKLSGTTLKVPLRCGKAAKCALSLRLSVKKLVIAKAKATLKAGQKKTVTLKLNRAGKRKLKKSRRLKARLKITLGGKTVATRTVKFKAKRKKR